MDSYISKRTRIQIDWFVDGVLKQTFDSCTHAADILKKEFNENINEYNIRYLIKNKTLCKSNNSIYREIHIFKENVLINVFNNNTEFIKYYNIKNKKNIRLIFNNKITPPILKNHKIEVVYNIPDIRLHTYNVSGDQICLYCEKSKPLTNMYYNYINKEEKIFHKKCIECFSNKLVEKRVNNFIETINDNWKHHPEFTNYYFERDSTKIFNTKTGYYLLKTPSINNKEIMARNLKWEAFYGKIPEYKIIIFKKVDNILNDNDGIELDNLYCVYIYCASCKKIIQKPKNSLVRHCSVKCKNFDSRKQINNNLNKYLNGKISSHKYINKKYNVLIDYDTEYLLSLGMNCYYCGISCKFGYEKDPCNPDTLSYDKKNSDIGYIKENIVVCCWFCNRMKNQTVYEDWRKFIDFVKNEENKELDLSNKTYAKNYKELEVHNLWAHIKQKSPGYYPNKNTAKQTFKSKCHGQNFLDPFFDFFPIVYLEKNCLFNASIDAIDTTLPEEEKHGPDNIQIVPKCFNYGKSILSNSQFKHEWEKRGFKTDFKGCSVKLPDNYYIESYFNNKILK
jgi:hypothetical protein